MNGFRILKGSKYPLIKYMRAKCCKTHVEFNIRLESEKGNWYMVYATKIDESLSDNHLSKVKDELKFDNGIFIGSDYACPYCGNKSIVRCGTCGRITCNDGGKFFKCEYCEDSGEIKGKITSVYVEQPSQHSKK